MASEFYLDIDSAIVYVRLFAHVDGFDVMSVHGNPEFMDLMREHKNVVYDYSEATRIDITIEDAKSFAKLAGLEAKLTSGLVISVIPRDAEHKKGAELYQNIANELGADIRIIE